MNPAVSQSHVSYLDFLGAFFSEVNSEICFRAFKPKDAPDVPSNRPQKLQMKLSELASGCGESELRGLNQTRGIYFAPNAGGHTDAEIREYKAVFVEKDDLTICEQHELLDRAPLKTSIRVETKRSVHAYWLLKPGCSAKDWKDAQALIIEFFDGDRANKNPSRLMRLPGFEHLTYVSNGELERKLVSIVEFQPAVRYSIDDILAAFPRQNGVKKSTTIQRNLAGSNTIIGNGHRNVRLFSIASDLRRAGLLEPEIITSLMAVNENRVRPPLQLSELQSIARNSLRYASDRSWNGSTIALGPPQLSEGALYGVAGGIVRTVAPHTEADPAALLVQLIAGFGSMIGRSAHFVAEADEHYAKINVVLAGASSRGRKGSSWGHIRRLLRQVDPTFDSCVLDGLSSGEGLVHQVRDPKVRKAALKGKKGKIVGYQDELEDEGAKEKRLFVMEPEFARVLRVMRRDGNTLSSLIRQAWDSDRLAVLTKSPVHASGAHISIVGHITIPELRRNLPETDFSNGFANRFVWVFTTRSKKLPFGGNVSEEALNGFSDILRGCLEFAKAVGRLDRSKAADHLWEDEYGRLTEGNLDLVGSITSRAEAQVMRLALVYAVLDCSRQIERNHLEAALALWQYALDSVRFIFGDRIGDRVADKIYSALKKRPRGLTRSEIQDLFSRNVSSERITIALNSLSDMGLIRSMPSKTGGRDATIYFAIEGSSVIEQDAP